MLSEALREGLAHLVGSVLLSEERMIGVLRETLRRYGIEEEEIEKAIGEARANLSRWRGTTPPGPGLGELAAAGIEGLLGVLGIPTKADLDAMGKNLEEAIQSRYGDSDGKARSGTTARRSQQPDAKPERARKSKGRA